MRSNFQRKKQLRPNNFLCLCLLVCVVRKLLHYKRMAYVLSKSPFNSNFCAVVELLIKAESLVCFG